MEKRWSLNNRLLPISYRQFVKLTEQFKRTAEKSYDSKCQLTVNASRALARHTTFFGDNMQRGLDEANKPDHVFRAGVAKITKDFWRNAQHVCVEVRPLTGVAARRGYSASVTFDLRADPKKANFYIQMPSAQPS
jgi:hypothetical protein